MAFLKKGKNAAQEESKILYRRTGAAKVLFAVMFCFFLVYTLSLILPFVWVFISAFKGDMEFADFNNSAFSLPEVWRWENWIVCFEALEVEETNFFGMLINSLWYVMIGALIVVFFEVASAYAIIKYNHFKICKIMYILVIFFMMMPVMGTEGARYRSIYELGLGDSPLYLIFCAAGFGSSFLIFCSSWEGVSNTYSEAAQIDGAGHFTIFFKIMLPMVSGPIVAVLILAFIGRWNSYTNILMYLPSYPTLATGLYLFQKVTDRMANIPVYFCGIFLSILPPLIIFSIFSETIMKNVTHGGIKG